MRMSFLARIIIAVAAYFAARFILDGIYGFGNFNDLSLKETLAVIPEWIAYAISLLFILWNIVVYIIYRADKKKAKNGQWRISEKTLLYCAVLFGAIGAWEGVFQARHKTQHLRFRVVVSLALFVQLILIFMLMRNIFSGAILVA